MSTTNINDRVALFIRPAHDGKEGVYECVILTGDLDLSDPVLAQQVRERVVEILLDWKEAMKDS